MLSRRSRRSRSVGRASPGAVPVVPGPARGPARRRAPVARWRPRETDRVAGQPHALAVRPRHFHHRIEVQRLGQGKGSGQIVDHPGRHSDRGQFGRPGRRGSRAQSLFELGAERGPVGDPLLVGGEAFVGDQLRRAEHSAKGGELAIVSDGQNQLPLAGVEQLVGGDARVRVPQTPGHRAGDRVGRALVDPGRRDRAESRSTSTSCPSPVALRWRSAARIPTVANRPARTSTSATPTFCGSPSGVPVMLISPPVA